MLNFPFYHALHVQFLSLFFSHFCIEGPPGVSKMIGMNWWIIDGSKPHLMGQSWSVVPESGGWVLSPLRCPLGCKNHQRSVDLMVLGPLFPPPPVSCPPRLVITLRPFFLPSLLWPVSIQVLCQILSRRPGSLLSLDTCQISSQLLYTVLLIVMNQWILISDYYYS